MSPLNTLIYNKNLPFLKLIWPKKHIFATFCQKYVKQVVTLNSGVLNHFDKECGNQGNTFVTLDDEKFLSQTVSLGISHVEKLHSQYLY